MPGTDLVYAATRPPRLSHLAQTQVKGPPSASAWWPISDGMTLRPCYAMSGTHLAYRVALYQPYALATQSSRPVFTKRDVSRYRPTPVLA
eukprot:2187215-Rhodomonas_salina.2